MSDVSILLCTARDDYSIKGQPKLHFLKPTIESLSKQRFKDFELIIVDALHHEREYDFSKLPYDIKHVPVHKDHRFWVDRKRWAVCSALNTAIIHAEGELIVRIDDCSEFDENFIGKFWEGYQSGYWPLAMHTRYFNGKQAYFTKKYKEKGYEHRGPSRDYLDKEERLKALRKIYGAGAPIRDSRYIIVEAAGGKMVAPLDWMYGYSSFTLDAALKVNGFDELFDGDKSLEDVDFGSRLNMAGYKNIFQLDVNHIVIEHEHNSIPKKVISSNAKSIKCNYAIYLLNRTKKRWKANTEILTSEDLDFIRNESLKPPCSPRPKFYDDDCEGELFNMWAENQPIFDLRMEKLSI